MTTIDRAAAERRNRKANKAGTILYTFLEMLLGRKEPERSYLGSLHSPTSFPGFFLFVFVVLSFAAIFIFGRHP